jgi:hypothetical protein
MKHLCWIGLLALSLVMLAHELLAADASSVASKADVTVTGTSTLVAASNASRVALSCTNTHATSAVRWGDSAVATTSGQQIKAGRGIEIRNSASVYMISEGADVTVACTEEAQ